MNPPGVERSDEPTASERWRASPRWLRAVVVLVAALAVIELGSSLVSGVFGSSPSGDQDSSSFGTSSSGVAAVTQLLAEHGHAVDRSTVPVSGADLPADTTLFVVDPVGWTPPDTTAVRSLLARGGHVVVAGQPPAGLATAMFPGGDPPGWQDLPAGPGPTARSIGSSSVVDGISQVSIGIEGSVGTVGDAGVILSGADAPFAVAGRAETDGGPQSVLIGSSTFLTNGALDRVDNAAFALNLAGPSGRPVVFDEYDHGYGRAGSGLAGLPRWWRWGLGLALAAMACGSSRPPVGSVR